MNRTQPVVSVALPAFNAGIFISEAIESIQNQTLKNWELMVVDDGSTDHTADLVEAFAKKDHRIRLIRINHSGIATALNVGMQHARSAYIARMDSDDVSLPDRLERQVNFLETHPEVDLVSSMVSLIKREKRAEGLETYVDWVNSLDTSKNIAIGRFVDAPVIHPSVCFRAELINRYGGYQDGDFPEDYELWLRWLDKGVRFSKLPEVLLQWRDHADKLTRVDTRYREEAMWAMKGQYFCEWTQRKIPDDRALLIWGSGRKTRSRLRYLSDLLRQHPIAAYIDVSPNKIGRAIDGVPVISPGGISDYDNAYVVGMVGSRGARGLIKEELEKQGKMPGDDFIFLA